MPKCKDCGADITWVEAKDELTNTHRWTPINTETVDDPDSHQDHRGTCRRGDSSEEKPLTREQLQRPGYL